VGAVTYVGELVVYGNQVATYDADLVAGAQFRSLPLRRRYAAIGVDDRYTAVGFARRYGDRHLVRSE